MNNKIDTFILNFSFCFHAQGKFHLRPSPLFLFRNNVWNAFTEDGRGRIVIDNIDRREELKRKSSSFPINAIIPIAT